MPKAQKEGERSPRPLAPGIDPRYELGDEALCAAIVWLHTGWRKKDRAARQGAYYLLRQEASGRGLDSFVQGFIRSTQAAERRADGNGKTRAIDLGEDAAAGE
jgi:hypothetical protein